jgi:hypothetical protein
MTDYASNEERDKVFNQLYLHPENKACFDCGSSNPKWASVNNAVFLCFQCAGKHRSYGVHISFMRSCALDKWKYKHLEQMKAGGNKAAKAYFEKNDLIQSGQHNYASPLAAKYRSSIEKKANSMENEVVEHKVEDEVEEEIEEAVIPEAKPVEKKVIIIEKKVIEKSIPAK